MKYLFTTILSLSFLLAFSQGPNNSGTYYKNASGKKGAALKTALYGIISNHTTLGYSSLNNYYSQTDARSDGKLWDMYSNVTNYSFSSTGGNSTEGAGWNKEHSIPQSWFGEASPMKSDIFHVVPTDAYINNMRSNYPYGETNNPTKTSKNGFSKLGPCSVSGYSGTCFEPNDEYKGDFARIYFYMVTCYENKSFTSSNGSYCFTSGTYPCFKDWFKEMLLRWAEEDPVSQKEIDRNNAAAKIQGNRNPFVDYPKLEQYIWGSCQEKIFYYDEYDGPEPVVLPDVPTAIAATEITKNGFRANWIDADNAESYTIELRGVQQGVVEDHVVLTETFAKFSGSGSNDISSSLDSKMDNKGWSGKKVFEDSKRAKMGSNSGASELTSPLMESPDGHVIINFTETSIDAATITVSILDSYGNEIDKKSLSSASTSHTVTFDNIKQDYRVSFTADKKNRYYMESIEVTAGGGAQSTTKTVEGIAADYYVFTNLKTGYTYFYKVKGVNKDGESDWSSSIEVVLKSDDALLGDANGDGVIDVADITAIAAMILGTSSKTSNADANKDGTIDVADITAVAALILGE